MTDKPTLRPDPKPNDKRPLARRFYKTVSVGEGDHGYRILLDSRELKTPAKRALALPVRPLAEAIAAEWDAQTTEINPHAMPIMQLAATALDRLAVERSPVVTAIARYAETDLLCYRCDSPADLAERQNAVWQPILDWAADQFKAPFNVTTSIIPIAQPEESLAAIKHAVDEPDPFRLAALSATTGSSGSVIIGLALLHGHLDAQAAFDAAQLDESYQLELWGEDKEALARRESLRAELAHAEKYLRLLSN